MDRVCFDCGKALETTGKGPGWMNAEQWDASKAGDFFAPCDKATHPNGNCYFNDTDTVNALKPLDSSPPSLSQQPGNSE